MTEASAIVALDQFARLDELLERRRIVAETYHEGLIDLPGLQPQRVEPGCVHSYVHWVMAVGSDVRAVQLAEHLNKLGVQTKPYYSPPLHRFLQGHRAPDGLSVSEALSPRVLALPMSSELTQADARRVVAAVRWSLSRINVG